MGIPQEALELEERAIQGEPTLGRAYDLLLGQWNSGDRSRELALHLMFLAWYLCIEPPFLTGLGPNVDTSAVFREVRDHLSKAIDHEFEYVRSVMMEVADWPGDSVDAIEATIGKERIHLEVPQPAAFAGRGFYGDYFTYMSREAARRRDEESES